MGEKVIGTLGGVPLLSLSVNSTPTEWVMLGPPEQLPWKHPQPVPQSVRHTVEARLAPGADYGPVSRAHFALEPLPLVAELEPGVTLTADVTITHLDIDMLGTATGCSIQGTVLGPMAVTKAEQVR